MYFSNLVEYKKKNLVQKNDEFTDIELRTDVKKVDVKCSSNYLYAKLSCI